MGNHRQLIRDFHAGQYLDLLLVSAVSAVLAIRFFLYATGYPTVGGDSLHIAHMLWGGLLMLVALILVLSYLGRRAHQLAALMGGVGFGTFIDEVGKFVTHDNDYFYRPSIAIMYVVFVLTYLVIRSIHRVRQPVEEEYLLNALQEVANVAVNDLDREERDRALRYLARADARHPLVPRLREVLMGSELVPTPNPHPLVRLQNSAIRVYRRAAATPVFPKAIIAFFVVQLAARVVHVLTVVLRGDLARPARGEASEFGRVVEELSFVDWAQLGSSLLSAVLVALGIVWIRRSRIAAFRWFQRSILVSIFITQLFTFYEDQWGALTALVFNLLVLLALNFAIEHETARRSSRV